MYSLELCAVHNKPQLASRFLAQNKKLAIIFEKKAQARIKLQETALAEAEVAAELRRTIQMAMCMGLNPKLGSNSPVNCIDEELVRMILAHADPVSV